MSNIKVFIHFAEGFEEIEAITPIDVLRRAGCETISVSITGNKRVNGAHDLPIETDMLFEDVNYDEGSMIILPGGMPGSANLNAHESLKQKIMEYYDQGKFLAAICAAPMVFGNLGILKGKNATCYPGFEEHLKRAKIVAEKVVVDGNIITGKGPGAALPFSLKLVELLFNNKEKVSTIAGNLIYDI